MSDWQAMRDIDLLWLVLATALVLLMQGGFLLLEAGLTRAKNYINVAVKNLADLGMAIMLFWLVGYGIMFGTDAGGVIGTSDFAIDLGTGEPGTIAFFIFQVVFAGTTVTIISGAIAERTAFNGYIGIVLAMAVVYPVYGHWVWSEGGWLLDLGFVDFAGSTVVHSIGGWAALAAMLVIGPRRGRFTEGGTSNPIRPSNLPLAMTGGVLLWVGWIGFNGGSTLAFTSSVPSVVAITMLGGAAGLVTGMLVAWWRSGFPVPTAPLNGALAGLVAVTAGAHALPAWAAAVVGAMGALVGLRVERLLEDLQIDDAVGAVPVHLGAGAWGTLAVGIFGRADTLGTDLSRLEQVGVQLLGIGAAAAWGFGVCFLVFRFLDGITPLRVPADHEDDGLNVAEHREPSAMIDLLRSMDHQARTGAITEPIETETFTEVGQIAEQFNGLTSELRSMARVAEQIADGRLDVDVVPRSDQDTFGLAFRRMVRDLRSTVAGISVAADELNHSAGTLSRLTETVESGARVQDQGVERGMTLFQSVDEFIDRLVAEVDQLGRRTNAALDELVVSIGGPKHSAGGGDDLKASVGAIDRAAGEITGIIDVVRSIVDTTKLLALNASIEASRAGEHGKAFAVVAEEVRALAAETMGSLEAIETVVHDLREQAGGAVHLVDAVVEEVETLSGEFATVSADVSRAAGDLQSQASQAQDAITSIGTVTRQNVEAITEFRDVTTQVQAGVGQVDERLSRFALNDEGSADRS